MRNSRTGGACARGEALGTKPGEGSRSIKAKNVLSMIASWWIDWAATVVRISMERAAA